MEIRGNRACWHVEWLVISFTVCLAEEMFGCCVVKSLPHKHASNMPKVDIHVGKGNDVKLM